MVNALESNTTKSSVLAANFVLYAKRWYKLKSDLIGRASKIISNSSESLGYVTFASQSKVAKALGVCRKTANRILNRLVKLGVLTSNKISTRYGSDNPRWLVVYSLSPRYLVEVVGHSISKVRSTFQKAVINLSEENGVEFKSPRAKSACIELMN